MRKIGSSRADWQAFLRRYSKIERVQKCGIHVDLRNGPSAQVFCNKRGKARWVNVHRCHLRWNCAVCGPIKEAEDRYRLWVSLLKAVTTPTDSALEFDPDEIERGPASLDFEATPAPSKYTLVFLTATAPHSYGNSLKESSDVITKAWNYATGAGRCRGLGGGYETWRDTFGVVGFVRCFDLTVGPNGWHPHLHAALVVETEKINEHGLYTYMEWFQAWFHRRWDHSIRLQTGVAESVCISDDCDWQGSETLPRLPTSTQRKARGYDVRKLSDRCPKCRSITYRPPCVSHKHGINAVYASSAREIASYLTTKVFKTGLELTSGHRKLGRDVVGGLERVEWDPQAEGYDGDATAIVLAQGGHRTPWQLLESLYDRERALTRGQVTNREKEQALFDAELALWHEYEAAMKGRRAMQASRDFWKHPDFGLQHENNDGELEQMTRSDLLDFLSDYMTDEEQDEEQDEKRPMLEVVQWLYASLIRYRLKTGQYGDAWALSLCEEAWHGKRKGYAILRAYVDDKTKPILKGPPTVETIMRAHRTPHDIKAQLTKLVREVELARTEECTS